jgi:hypothetical protein
MVKINIFSDEDDVNCGVPQGSILGPIFYLIYVAGVNKCFKYCHYFIYADDICIIAVHKDIKTAIEYMKEDLLTFQLWVHGKELTINVKKTKIVHITSPHLVRSLPIEIMYHDIDCIHRKAEHINAPCHCNQRPEVVQSYMYILYWWRWYSGVGWI